MTLEDYFASIDAAHEAGEVVIPERPLHRERDRPASFRTSRQLAWWDSWIDRICVRGGVPFTHEGLLRDYHRHVKDSSLQLDNIRDLDTVRLSRWESAWERRGW